MAKRTIRAKVLARRKALAATLCGQLSTRGLRPSKDQELIHKRKTNCCIPAGSIENNPYVTTKVEDGKKVHYIEWNLDALESYREIKAQWQKYNRKHFSVKYGRKPWYMMTTGKQRNYEERTESYGQAVQYYPVPSEAKKFHDKNIVHHMTHKEYLDRLIQAKLDDWVKKNPRPIKKDSDVQDMFESQFMVPWVQRHTEAREKIMQFVHNIGTKVQVFARYNGDTGYPRRVTEFRSDHQKLMIMDGKYANHLGSKTIQKVQRIADRLGRFDSSLIALKVVDGSQECILIPNPRFKAAA